MSPELIVAIRERLQSGQTKEEIKTAVLALGHADVVFEAAYTLALHDMHGVSPVREESLPRASELVVGGWNFLRTHLNLVVLLLVPAFISAILQWTEQSYTSVHWLEKVSFGLNFVTAILYLFCIMAVLYSISTDGAASQKSTLSWVGKHVYGFLWLNILSALLVWGGFVFFIVPGFIVLVMICFGQYAFVLEERRGMDALLRSRELVHGRFWQISLVLGKFWLLLCVPLFLVGLVIVSSDIVWKFSDTSYATLAGNLLLEVFMVFANIISMHAMFNIYRVLQGRVSAPATASIKVRYWFLVGFGIVMAVIIVMFLFLKNSANSLYEDIPSVSDSTTIQNEIRTTSLPAREYMLAHSQSYEGVCEVLSPTLSTTEGVTCNDNEKEWAISAKIGDEAWCADTQTTLKKTQTDLGDSTKCLQLP